VNGVTTQFLLSGGEEIADFAGSGVGTPQTLTVRGIAGLPVASITPSTGAVVFYHHDVLGSTVAVTQAGTPGPADIYTYGDFGSPGAGSWAVYRVAGYRYDNETGLYYVGARQYSANLGRFLQPDPIGIRGGRNLYAYTHNDPLNFADPTGLSSDLQANGGGNGGGFWHGLATALSDPTLLAQIVVTEIVGLGPEDPLADAAVVAEIAEAERTAQIAGEVAEEAGSALPDSALVCRGGTCTAERFANGSGVTVDAAGNLQGVSVNSAPGASLDELTSTIPNGQVGVTTVGDIRAAGGSVTPSPTAGNPFHCTLCGITPQQGEELFTPTVPNPNR